VNPRELMTEIDVFFDEMIEEGVIPQHIITEMIVKSAEEAIKVIGDIEEARDVVFDLIKQTFIILGKQHENN